MSHNCLDYKYFQTSILYKRATKVLTENRGMLDEMAQMLIERETIDTEDIQDLINRSEVKVANYL